MLIRIGRHPEPLPDDVVGALLACHARIRSFSAIGVRIGAGEGSAEEVAAAAAAVERYFRVALPLHVADEEISLRPRLLAAGISPDVRAAVDAMTEEHAAIEALLAALLPRWAAVAARPAERSGLALGAASAELARRFDAHLAQEERVLFPAVRAHLAAAGPEIRAEMRERRAGDGRG